MKLYFRRFVNIRGAESASSCPKRSGAPTQPGAMKEERYLVRGVWGTENRVKTAQNELARLAP